MYIRVPFYNSVKCGTFYIIPLPNIEVVQKYQEVPDASKEKPSTPSQSNKHKKMPVVSPNICIFEVLLEFQQLSQTVDSPSQKPSVQQAEALKQSFRHRLEGGFDGNFQLDMINLMATFN
ncbi:hypothetical protein D8674_012735 [Pyrus ussuriensis x Pyrus communis]|uniref:Uncharacterized protein n=1 Tax=Pyrus ussuriensis x Pyrus communis TaxID=2448454 RepID=A0A5N5GMR7_9ROSA|nr:hypothetical protein D8674_012735 [Pyrus ussuriensis x Pyrus communis]